MAALAESRDFILGKPGLEELNNCHWFLHGLKRLLGDPYRNRQPQHSSIIFGIHPVCIQVVPQDQLRLG